LSNDLEKSQNTKQLVSFFSGEFRMQLYISKSWCTVEYLPDIISHKMLKICPEKIAVFDR
jgi:hypothetical protein